MRNTPKYMVIVKKGNKKRYLYFYDQKMESLPLLLEKGWKLFAGYRATWKKFKV